jgi:transposase InsO family protein
MEVVVLAQIKEQSRLSFSSCGRPKMTEKLKEVGVDVGHRLVGRLAGQKGIVVERTRKFKATTDCEHTFNIAPNLLDGHFTGDRPNQKCAGDISHIWTEGWLFLAVILDLHSRRVIDLAVSNLIKLDAAIRALKTVNALRSPPWGCIFHSDRGSKYCSHDHKKVLHDQGLKPSMSGKGNCHDNFGRDLLQDYQSRGNLVTYVGDTTPSRNRHPPNLQRLLQPGRSAFSTGRQEAVRLRTESGSNENLERHKYATGPVRLPQPFAFGRASV